VTREEADKLVRCLELAAKPLVPAEYLAARKAIVDALAALPEPAPRAEAEATIEGAGMIGTSVELTLRLPLAPCPIRFGDKVRVSWGAPAPSAPTAPTPAPRPEVMAFARAMEAKLRKHDAKRGTTGWKRDRAVALAQRLREEVDELDGAAEMFEEGEEPAENVLSEAADVGNFAMMIADVCGALRAPAPSAPTTPAPPTPCDDHRPDGPSPDSGCKCAEVDRLFAPLADAARAIRAIHRLSPSSPGEPCPECGGTGDRPELNPRSTDCPDCGGSGRVPGKESKR
jgi:hypothetical protein